MDWSLSLVLVGWAGEVSGKTTEVETGPTWAVAHDIL